MKHSRGKKGAEKRWNKNNQEDTDQEDGEKMLKQCLSNAKAYPQAMPEQCLSNAIQNQNQNYKDYAVSTQHMSESVDSDQIAPPAENKKSPPCPYQKILEIYHEVLPELPAVRVLTDARERVIRGLWLHNPDLDWWRDYFQDVRRSDFLMGRSKPGNGRTKPFMADLEWLVKPGNFAKVYEGRYHS
jgi:hypothetical protein